MSKAIIFLFITFFTLVSSSYAQVPSKREYKGTFNSYHLLFNAEYDFNYNYNLSSILESRGLPAFNDKPMVFGAGINYLIDRQMVRIDFNINYQKKNEEAFVAKQRLNVFGLTWGYNVLKSNSWILAPYVGARVRILNFKYTEKLPELNFEQLLDYNPNDLSLRYSKVSLDLGLTIAHQNFHHVEIRAGYNVPITKNKWWDANRVNSYSGISNYMTGWYVRLAIGIGSKGADL